MPAASLFALIFSILWIQPAGEVIMQQRPIDLEFFDPYDRSTYQFNISESAYIAVFEVGQRRATLVYPAIGPELRKIRYNEMERLETPDNLFEAGRHLLPPRSGRVWSGTTDTGFLMKGDHILIVASRRQFDFERLNDLYVGQDDRLARRNSFGAVDDFTHILLKAILPEYDADDWTAYLHWVRQF